MGRQCDCLIAQITESFKVNLIDLIRKLTTDCSRLIGAVGINNDQLISPACHRLKAGPHIGLVVVRDDVDRYSGSSGYHSFFPSSFQDQILF